MSKVIWIIKESVVNVILDDKIKVVDSGTIYVDRVRGYSETREGAKELMRRIRDQKCENNNVAWDYENDLGDHDLHDFCYIEDEWHGQKYGKSYYLRTDSVLTEIILP